MDPHITDDNRGARLRFRRLERERAAAITQIRDLMLKYEISMDDIQKKINYHSESDAFRIGYRHGEIVPASPASSTQAWSDCRATNEIEHNGQNDADYIRGHMAGQENS